MFKDSIFLGKDVDAALKILERELGAPYRYCKTLGGCSNEVHIIENAQTRTRYIMRFTRESRFRNYDIEKKIISHVVGKGLATSRAYLFADGIVTERIEGECIESDSMLGEKPYYELITRQMRRLHEISVKGELVSIASADNHYGLKLFLDISMEYVGTCRESAMLHKLYTESGLLSKLVHKHPSLLWTCISHNDLHSGNILYSSSTKSVKFIDWEYSACNLNFFDIACFFLEFTGINCDISVFPCTAKRLDFYQYYFGDATALIDSICLFFVPLACLFWAAWSSKLNGLDLYTQNRARLGRATLHKVVNTIWPQDEVELSEEDFMLLKMVDFTFHGLSID